MKLRLFKRAETVSRESHRSLIERYEASLASKDDTIERLANERNEALRLASTRGTQLEALRADHQRRIAPLMAANAARKEAAAAKRKAGA